MARTITRVTGNYGDMTKEEVLAEVIKEVQRIEALGEFPDTKTYRALRSRTAPAYEIATKIINTPWRQVLKLAGVKPRIKTKTQTIGWSLFSPEEILDMALKRMHELPRLTFQTYQQEHGLEAPSPQVLLTITKCKWNDVMNKYVERYGRTPNLSRERTIPVPLSRYEELLQIEREYKKLGK